MTRPGHLARGVTGKMVFELMLTILLGTSAGVAAVLYTVKPRHVGASQSFGASSIETISIPSQSTFSQIEAAPAPEVSAAKPPVVEAPAEEFHAISPAPVPTTALVAVAGQSDAASASTDAPPASPAPQSFAPDSPAAPRARAHRAPRRTSVSSRAPAKPRAAASPASRAIKKR
jgi:hypothetical protein